MADKIYKNPSDLADNIVSEKKWNPYFQKYMTDKELYDEHSKTPLDDFKNFENSMYIGGNADQIKNYGLSHNDRGGAYTDLLDSYSKSKGKHAAVALTDPEIKKYYEGQLARRQAIADRFKKIPLDKSAEFQLELAQYLDPFDFEEEYFKPEDLSKSTLLDAPYDWDNVEEFLTQKGY